MSHQYKFVEALLQWYFGEQVSTSYRYDETVPGVIININGETILEDAGYRINTDLLTKHLEDMGLKRQ
ncbi:hypothetical protein [Desulfocucumis palustris]|uniref:hypothetical protein n=1 Tax=Desulfocucumis palustris TaxID=1898651 RepID=UPI000FFE51B0|nr:hypothetical protein [Desulfocucumis palustris]